MYAACCRDVLCTDKTGTLTVDEVTLLKALDLGGNESLDILKLAYANSHFQVRLCPACVKESLFFSLKISMGLCMNSISKVLPVFLCIGCGCLGQAEAQAISGVLLWLLNLPCIHLMDHLSNRQKTITTPLKRAT